MKVTYRFLVLALLAGFFLSACGEKGAIDEMPAIEDMAEGAADAVEDMAESTTDAMEDMAESATDAVEDMASDEPGGYVPTADELVPGETRP